MTKSNIFEIMLMSNGRGAKVVVLPTQLKDT